MGLGGISGTVEAVVVADGHETVVVEAEKPFAEWAPGFDGEGTPGLLAAFGRIGQGGVLEAQERGAFAVVVVF